MNTTERDWSVPIKGSDFTPELARDFLVEMCKRGCGYAFSDYPHTVWEDSPKSTPAFSISNWNRLFRLPPIPRTEPFNQQTVPKGALWRNMNKECIWYTANRYEMYKFVISITEVSYDELSGQYEYSIDGGLTWNKSERKCE